MGMWYVGGRVAAKSYDGEHTVICVVNWTENEQDWKGVQFVSTATAGGGMVLTKWHILL